jgi:hypothetical protein
MYVIKEFSKALRPLRGLSYALSKNLKTGGLRCDLFYSHAWDEGIYELAKHVRASWPDDCEGAYICCLSNPQILDISAVLNHPEGSPFERVLGASPRPKAMVMLANRNTAIHTRLWCVLEAKKARENAIAELRIEGPATQLVTGARGEDLKRLEIEIEEKTRVAKVRAVAAFEAGVGASGNAKTAAEAEKDELQKSIGDSLEELARAKLSVLLAPASELIDLSKASCSYEQDTIDIRRKIAGSEAEIVELVAELIRDNACGMKPGHRAAVDGPLGALSLTEESVTIGGDGLGSPSGVLQLGEWLRSGAKATSLKYRGGQLLVPEGPRVVLESTSLTHFGAIPLVSLRENSITELDLTSKGVGVPEAIILSSLMPTATALTSLSLERNQIGPDGTKHLSSALLTNTTLKELKYAAPPFPRSRNGQSTVSSP